MPVVVYDGRTDRQSVKTTDSVCGVDTEPVPEKFRSHFGLEAEAEQQPGLAHLCLLLAEGEEQICQSSERRRCTMSRRLRLLLFHVRLSADFAPQ